MSTEPKTSLIRYDSPATGKGWSPRHTSAHAAIVAKHHNKEFGDDTHVVYRFRWDEQAGAYVVGTAAGVVSFGAEGCDVTIPEMAGLAGERVIEAAFLVAMHEVKRAILNPAT